MFDLDSAHFVALDLAGAETLQQPSTAASYNEGSVPQAVTVLATIASAARVPVATIAGQLGTARMIVLTEGVDVVTVTHATAFSTLAQLGALAGTAAQAAASLSPAVRAAVGITGAWSVLFDSGAANGEPSCGRGVPFRMQLLRAIAVCTLRSPCSPHHLVSLQAPVAPPHRASSAQT